VTEQPENQPSEGESGAVSWAPADSASEKPAEAVPTEVTPPAAPLPVSGTEPASQPTAASAAITPPPVPGPTPPPPPSGDGGVVAPATDRPEVAIGAAFAGGFAIAMLLRRLAR
jgi:hypothetical protein